MGFGSGGGGFTPSPNNVPGSTKTGTDKDTDVHEFTGSVDITGSLTLNGSAITGGGGGGGTPGGSNSQVQYNDGGSFGGASALVYDDVNNRVGIGTGTPTAALHVSSSTSDPLFRVDHSTQSGAKPILFVTGSGLVGIGTDAPRTDTVDTNRLHILGESGADQGQDPVDNTLLMLENNDHVGVQFMTPIDKSGFLVWGDADAARVAHFYFLHNDNRFHFDSAPYGTEAMTVRASGDSVNMGENNSAHMLTAKASLHISSSTGGTDIGGPVLLRVDHGDQPEPVLFVTGSGQVGIGTETPDSTLEILSTSTQQKWSYDADSFATLTVADGGDTTLSSSEGGNITLDADDILLQSNGGQVKIDRPGGSTRLQFDVSTSTSLIDNPNNNDIAFRLGTGLKELLRFDQSENALLMSGTFNNPGGDAAINFRDTATSIHSPDFNRLAITAPTLEVTGTLAVTDTNSSGSVAVDLAKMGADPGRSGAFILSHVDHFNASGYAIQQRSNGDTVVNAPAGRAVGLRIGGNNALTVAGGYNNNVSIGNLGAPTARLHVTGASGEQDLIRVDAADTSTVFFVTGSGRVGVNTALPVQTFSVSGSAAFSGAFGSTAIETLTANGTISANTGLTLIDASSSLAVNNTLSFTIANGTFAGQEKKIRGLIISGSDGTTSTGISIAGANIDSPPTSPAGQINLSSSFGPGSGPLFQRAGCSLVWDGSKWLPVGNFNFDINNTGRTFI